MATYYLSPTGKDTNDGTTAATAWKNLDMIYKKCYSAAPFVAGDSILLERGRTFNGQLILRAAGTAIAPILVGAYGSGANPIIAGDCGGAAWTAVPGRPGFFSTPVGAGSILSAAYTGTTRLTAVSGAPYDLSVAADLKTFLDSFAMNSWGPSEATTTTVWARSPCSRPPINAKIFRDAAIFLLATSAYVTIANIDVRRSNIGIDLNGCSHCTIRDCSVSDCLGTAIYLRLANTDCLVENNTVFRLGNTALYIYGGSANILRGNTITDVSNSVLGIAVSADQCGIGLQESDDNIVEYNRLAWIRNGGVDFYDETGTIVRYNYLFHTGGGMWPNGSGLQIYFNYCNIDGTGAGIVPAGDANIHDNTVIGAV